MWSICRRLSLLAIAPGPCRALVGSCRIGRAYSSDETTTFYNSQAGRWMTKPGALGLRVHELFTVVAGLGGLVPLLPANLSSFAWPLGKNGEPTLVHPMFPGSSVHLVVPVSNPEDINALHAAAPTAASSSPIKFQPEVAMQLGPKVDEGELDAARALVKRCVAAGLPPRALLRHVWAAPPDDADENLHAESLVEVTLALADAEAAVIVLSDCLSAATEDSLRDAVELVFNIDCAGESMMERVALRLPRADLCSGALRLGVTRFDTNACPHAGGGEEGACGAPPGAGEGAGCMCRRAGLGVVVGTEQLVEAAVERGIKHRVELAALKACRDSLRKGLVA